MSREPDPEIAADLARIAHIDRPRLDDDEFSARARQTGIDARETIRAGAVETHCERCKHIVKPFYRHCPRCEGWTNRLQVERLAEAIEKVKQQPPGKDQEHAYIRRLIELGHPDAVGFIAALTGDKNPARKRRGAL